MSTIKYPQINVRLSGEDGNAFSILGRVSKAMKHADIGQDEIERFQNEAMSGDYDNLLQTCMRWVSTS